MTRAILCLISVQACAAVPHGHGPARGNRIPASWHWPCKTQHIIATWHEDPIGFRLEVNDIVKKINAVAGRDVLRLIGPVTSRFLPGITVVSLDEPGSPMRSTGGAMPVYSGARRCIDHWQVAVKKPYGTLTVGPIVRLILTHEILHVVGLEHVVGSAAGVMTPMVKPSHTADLSRFEKELVRCIAWSYLDAKNDPARGSPMGLCVGKLSRK